MSRENTGGSTVVGEPCGTLLVESARSPMPETYRELVVRILEHNWAAEAANASLSYHAKCCPLHLAPTMEDRAALGAYWADECRHSVMFAKLLAEFGDERKPEDYEQERPGEMLQLPVNSWLEHGLFQLFADSAGGVHLSDYWTCSYLPLRHAAKEIAKDEGRHIALGMHNIQMSIANAEGRARALELLPVWYRAAIKMFGHADQPSSRATRAIQFGIRRHDNKDLLAQFRRNVDHRLSLLGLPTVTD